MASFSPSQRGDARTVTLIVSEIDSDHKEIGRVNLKHEYKYGDLVDGLISSLIKGYKVLYNAPVRPEDVHVYALSGTKLLINDAILDGQVGKRDPRLQVVVVIRIKPVAVAPISVKRGSHDTVISSSKIQEVSLIWTEQNSDRTETQNHNYKFTYSDQSQVRVLKSYIINHYNKEMSLEIAPEDITIMNVDGITLDSASLIRNEAEKSKEPTLLVNVNLKPPASETSKSISVFLTEQYADDTSKMIRRSLNYKTTDRTADLKSLIVSGYSELQQDTYSITITNSGGFALHDDDLLTDDITLVRRYNSYLQVLVFMSNESMKTPVPPTYATSFPLSHDKIVNGAITTEVGNSKQSESVDSIESVKASSGGSAISAITGAAYQDCNVRSSTSTAEVGRHVTTLFSTELKLKEEDLEQVLPLLRSMGICTMDSLLSASSEQIVALKLKSITAKKLEKLLETRRRDRNPVMKQANEYPTISMLLDDFDESVVIDDLLKEKKEDLIIIATENLASTEELVAQLKDCADKIRKLIEVQDSNMSNIKSRIDESRSYLDRRVTRLSRLIQERKKKGKVIGSATQSVSTGCGKGGNSESTTLSEKGKRVDPITKTRKVTMAAINAVREFNSFGEDTYSYTYVDYEKDDRVQDEMEIECITALSRNTIGSVVSMTDAIGATSFTGVPSDIATTSTDTWFCGHSCKRNTTVIAGDICEICFFPAAKIEPSISVAKGSSNCSQTATSNDIWCCNSLYCGGRIAEVDSYSRCKRCHYPATNTGAKPSIIGAWTCTHCNSYNDSACNKCLTCNDRNGIWYCAICDKTTTVNIFGKCATCNCSSLTRQSPRPSNTGGWKCSYCNNDDNGPANDKCSGCAQPRYTASNTNISGNRSWFMPYRAPSAPATYRYLQ